MGPESAQEFLEGLDGEELEFAENNMVPCASCGEMRPKDDPVIRRHGVCHMCAEDPVRSSSPVADANLRYFVEQRDQDAERIRRLEAENKYLRDQLAALEDQQGVIDKCLDDIVGLPG